MKADELRHRLSVLADEWDAAPPGRASQSVSDEIRSLLLLDDDGRPSAQHLRAILPALDGEIDALRRWKAEAIEVEAQWDVQAIGKLLDLPLGASVRPAIQPALEALIKASAK